MRSLRRLLAKQFVRFFAENEAIKIGTQIKKMKENSGNNNVVDIVWMHVCSAIVMKTLILYLIGYYNN